ncbi:SURF1 family protein [Actinoplanes couchii]|uniref:SURF1-like protein n=1 Tax=Actinoplanes couchii TaxID=403638 RepID=A0ABQ3XB07_9ACTN|nr:SURF1 family protein [Actinoplanes couchii]MDR6323137.1 cytochrome oxidase assembly protein ShyY1 [Actinoplanes couchii]GID55651.1 SURF1-like protein [Actinoplanes couchii]
MYRFLLTPRWLGAAALTVVASAVMVVLGNWQLHRYQERTGINQRIEAAAGVDAVPLSSVMGAPAVAGTAGPNAGKSVAWTKVTISGRYDPANEIQARGRTVGAEVGFEIVTPLILDDGTAVLIDRGWVPAPAGGALLSPEVPAAPTGRVTVVGKIHLSESRPAPVERRDGRLDTRRINLPRLATELPYPVYGSYLLLTEQTPAADPAFVQIPSAHEDAWQNGGYAVQWWIFSGMVFVLYGWQARREALERAGGPLAGTRSAKAEQPLDRVAAADARAAARAASSASTSGDRVAEADARDRAATVTAERSDGTERRLAAPDDAG